MQYFGTKSKIGQWPIYEFVPIAKNGSFESQVTEWICVRQREYTSTHAVSVDLAALFKETFGRKKFLVNSSCIKLYDIGKTYKRSISYSCLDL